MLGSHRHLPAGCWTKLQKVTGQKRNDQNWVASQRQQRRSKPLRGASSLIRAVGVPGVSQRASPDPVADLKKDSYGNQWLHRKTLLL
jgi:hypothetical protein